MKTVRRYPFALGVLIGLLCSLLILGDWRAVMKIADAQVPFGAFRIMDGTHTQLARVNHTGQLAVDATVTVATDNVNVFHQSTVRHISSVTHVAAADGGLVIRDPLNAGARARVDHTGALVTSATVTVTTDNVNVFHQSTVRHVSSVTHIASAGLALANQALAVRCVDTGGTTFQACGGGADPQSVVQSSTWTIQAAHLVTIAHIAQSVHIGGTIQGAQFHVQGLGLPGASHGGVLTIQGITGMNAVVVSQTVASSLQMTAGHISSTTHVAGNVRLMSGTPNNQLAIVTHFGALAVTCYTAGGATETCGGTGGSGDAVNVFHQSTIRHVSSVTHVVILDWQRWAHLQVSQSGSWTIQAAHQGGEWNVRHITSVTHVQGSMQITATYGQRAFLTHFGALAVTCYTNAGVAESCAGTSTPDAVNVFHQSTIRHISSVTHVSIIDWQRWAHVQTQTFQSGSWTIQAAHQGGEWNIRHVTSVTHVAIMSVAGTNLGLGAGLPIGHITSVLHISAAGTPWNFNMALAIRCVNTGATAFESCGGTVTSDTINVFHQSTVAHVSSVTHVMVASHQVLRVMGAHVTGSIHVAGLTNVGSGAPGTGTTQMVCHSTLAIHVAAAAPGYTQIIHLTSSNGGINQAQWRIYICSIMVVSAHAQGFSLLEGVGTTCFGQPRHALIGSWRPDDSVVLAANGGFSLASPFPVLSTQVPGNNLCIAQTTRTSGGSISGTMSYRAGP